MKAVGRSAPAGSARSGALRCLATSNDALRSRSRRLCLRHRVPSPEANSHLKRARLKRTHWSSTSVASSGRVQYRGHVHPEQGQDGRRDARRMSMSWRPFCPWDAYGGRARHVDVRDGCRDDHRVRPGDRPVHVVLYVQSSRAARWPSHTSLGRT